MIDSAFWLGKRVLITGHTGFKGAWLAFWLQSVGAKVSGIALAPNTTPNIFDALDLQNLVDHHEIDIRDKEKLSKAIAKIAPEIVFHMAAQPLVRLAYRDPLSTYETNVMGTANVLWSLKDLPSVRSIVVITTDKCYENREWQWGYRETDALGGYDPYSSSKACTEILTASFRRSYFSEVSATSPRLVGLATARAGNVIGGGDWSEDRLIPDAVRSITASQTLNIRYPKSTRPWQHVLVPLSGYVMLAEKLWDHPSEFSEAFNFAPEDEDCVPVQTILDRFGHAWGRKVNWTTPEKTEAHEATFLKLDSSKSKARLAWHPCWQLNQALRATADWYRTFTEDRTKIASLTLEQIQTFTSEEFAKNLNKDSYSNLRGDL